jgi:hypothetical protein
MKKMLLAGFPLILFLTQVIQAQITQPTFKKTDSPLMEKAVVWSDWETLNPDSFVKMRWKKSGNEITVELFNSSSKTYKGDFTANFCDETYKGMNSWEEVILHQKHNAFFKIRDLSPGNCTNAGFHIWYKNFKTHYVPRPPIFGG